jgi:hypothetical protein
LADSNSDKYIGTLSGANNVVINSIKARSDSSNIYTKVKVAESGLRNNFALSEDILTLDSTGLSGTYKAQYLSSTGELVIAKDVHNFVLSARNEYGFENATRTFTLDSNVDVAQEISDIGSYTSYSSDSIGSMSNTTSFTVDGTTEHRYSINGNTKDGMSVSDGQTLTFRNIGDVYGFSTNAVSNSGILNISDSKFTSNIANAKTMN